jgi:mono/diheme cytochrome c family protein
MYRLYTFALRFIAALVTYILLATNVNAQVIDEYSGQETFMRYCAACHGESGMGDGPVAAGLPIQSPT